MYILISSYSYIAINYLFNNLYMQDIPSQSSGIDCGVFALCYGRCIVFNHEFCFSKVYMHMLSLHIAIRR